MQPNKLAFPIRCVHVQKQTNYGMFCFCSNNHNLKMAAGHSLYLFATTILSCKGSFLAKLSEISKDVLKCNTYVAYSIIQGYQSSVQASDCYRKRVVSGNVTNFGPIHMAAITSNRQEYNCTGNTAIQKWDKRFLKSSHEANAVNKPSLKTSQRNKLKGITISVK